MKDFEELIANGVRLCLNAGQTPGHVISDGILDAMGPAVIREAARRGWISSVNHGLHVARVQTARDAAATAGAVVETLRVGGAHPSEGRNVPASWAALHVTLQASDGSLKKLLDFTLDDLRYFEDLAQKQAAGWSSKAALATRAKGLLLTAHKATVRELSVPGKDELNALAEEAWKR